MARERQKQNKNPKKEELNYSSKEWEEAQNKMNQLIKQNKELSDAIKELKSNKSTSFNGKEKV